MWSEQLCRGCHYNQGPPEAPRWINHLYWIHLILQGGMPAGAEDLPLETRFDLGELREHIQSRRAGMRPAE